MCVKYFRWDLTFEEGVVYQEGQINLNKSFYCHTLQFPGISLESICLVSYFDEVN